MKFFTCLDLPYEALDREPTDKELDTLANHVIDESLHMSVQLGIDADGWLKLKADGNSIVKINRDILGKWRNEHPGKPKIRELAQALCNVGISIDALLSE